jgi:hypothetical protein
MPIESDVKEVRVTTVPDACADEVDRLRWKYHTRAMLDGKGNPIVGLFTMATDGLGDVCFTAFGNIPLLFAFAELALREVKKTVEQACEKLTPAEAAAYKAECIAKSELLEKLHNSMRTK